MQKRRRSARTRIRFHPLSFLRVWLSRHLQVALASLGHLVRSPLPTVMTIAVIAIALALPAGLFVVTRNLAALSESWDHSPAISLFLTPGTDVKQARALAAQLEAHSGIGKISLISPDEALADLRGQDGFNEAIRQLDKNPLPFVLSLQPAPALASPDALDDLRRELEALPQADFARLDAQWVRRFQAILDLGKSGVALFGSMLALGVLLVVGNTIRLEIENRRHEIEIMELVGATPAFIRRPFLYTGCWYGLLGGVSAWILIAVVLLIAQGPVSRLADLYQARFPLFGMGLNASLTMLGGSLCLGLVGSWVSVGRHLVSVEPH